MIKLPTARDGYKILQGDCLDVLPGVPDASIDAVITDPPYPEIDRDYGRWTEAEWWDLMMIVCKEVRRVLKPAGSAVFVLQANCERVGRVRPWLWDFMSWVCKEWNMVQDVWWWNFTTLPTAHTQDKYGLFRPSVKACVWAGHPECHRDQSCLRWGPSDAMRGMASEVRSGKHDGEGRVHMPSGSSINRHVVAKTVTTRGGSTPFNLMPVSNADSSSSAGSEGHGAGTPMELCRRWVRYICPAGGLVLDPFAGTSTVGVAALRHTRRFLGVEAVEKYHEVSKTRLLAEWRKCRSKFSWKELRK